MHITETCAHGKDGTFMERSTGAHAGFMDRVTKPHTLVLELRIYRV